MLILLNCRNYRHTEEYRHDVFFDLVMERHVEEKDMLYANATCCVLSYENDKERTGNVVLSFWRFKKLLEYNDRGTWALAFVRSNSNCLPTPNSRRGRSAT